MGEITKSDQKKLAGQTQPNNLDFVLNEVGEFRKHQILHFTLMVLPIILASTYTLEFIVTSSTSDYRCKIPGCDSPNEINNYDQPWLQDAIPYKHGRPVKCLQYNATVNSNSSSLMTTPSNEQTCSMVTFDHSEVIQCNEFIFKTNEHRISKEFNITCEENEYKLALIGTIHNMGALIFMPLTGFLSDKFGRLRVMVWNLLGSAIIGIAKGTVRSYTSLLICEFSGAAMSTSANLALFVLCVEWVSAKYRVMSKTIIGLVYPFGGIALGLAAMYYDHYRPFLLFLYTPGLFTIFYFWLVPESVRWLVVTGQQKAALTILRQAARNNKTTISEKSHAILRQSCNASLLGAANIDEDNEHISTNRNESVTDIFKHKILIARMIVCSICWIVTLHLYYGLNMSATKIAGDSNKYLSYIVVAAAEIPAALISYFLLDYAGRRTTLCGSLVTAGIATITSALIPVQQVIVIRLLSFIGMCATSCALGVIFIYSAELWPTPMRNLMINLCSMIGRSGSTVAPFTTLLAQYSPVLPYVVFGGTAIFAGCIILILPETLKKKLPDTIEEACDL